MMDLREECIEEKPGNAAFWEEVKQEGRPMSLISKPEAAMSGGKSRISESVSAEVCAPVYVEYVCLRVYSLCKSNLKWAFHSVA